MKTKTYSITRIINTSSDRVYKVISDANNYDQWNSIIPFAKGELKEGETLHLRMKSGNKTRSFKPKVISVTEGKSFTLSKIIISKGVGELTHRFDFKSLSPNQTEFTQTWIGEGWLVKMMWPIIAKGFSDFEILNDDLEKHLESTKNQN